LDKKKLFKNRKMLLTGFDINLILCILFINIFGIIMIYSASSYYAKNELKLSADYFFKNQLLFVSLGFLAMLAISFVRPSIWNIKFFRVAAIACSIIIILTVRMPGIGYSSHGAYRWIKIFNKTIQIAEPVKIFVIIALAGFLSQYKINNRNTLICVFGFVSLVSLFLLFVSNNMSTAIIVFAMAYFTVMIISPNAKPYVFLVLGAFVFLALVIFIIVKFIPYSDLENFRITRIRAWIEPDNEQFVDAEAYQATQALYAIASGGFFGKGLGKSLIKYTLPEPHNDYILAIIFEELGVFGVVLLTYLFVYLLYKIFTIYLNTKERFSKIMVLGVFLHFALQIVMNYGVTLGLFPTMGVTLPFISAGGSAAFFSLIELGLVIAVDRANTERKLYEEAQMELENEDPYYKQLQDEKQFRIKMRKMQKRKRRA